MSEKDILTKKSLDIEDNLAKTEENFIASYGKHEQKPLQILLSLYKGHYLQLILSGIFFALKHACVWYLPVATAGVINIASGYDDAGLSGIIFYISIEIGLVLINVPANYLYVHFRSLAIRNMEAGLRGALVRKLQQLSITYHKEMQSGRLQSKIMRDVEQIQNLASQIFISLLTIILNIGVSFGGVIFKRRIVFLFFLCTILLHSQLQA